MLNSRISLLATVVALGTALPLVAQEAAAPAAGETAAPEAPAASPAAPEAAPAATSETTPEATTEAAPAAAPEAGAAGQGEQADGAGYVNATFEAWQQRCVKTSLGADPCQLYTLLKDGEGNNVAEFTLFNLPEGAGGEAVAGANFIAPLETLLTDGMRLQVDTAAPLAYPFAVCSQIGCVSRVGLTAKDVAALKKGAKATFTIVPYIAPDQEVKLEVSLKGFTAAYDSTVELNKKADAAALAAQKSGN